jgi:dTDP-4-dehydrorhamnose reductase
MKHLLVLGCHGLLGQNLVKLATPHYRVTGIGRKEATFLDYSRFNYLSGDLTDSSLVDLIREQQPDLIVNCAGWTAVDLAETQREQCWQVNQDGVRNLITAARLTKAHLIQISTDYVFDGKTGPYHERSEPNPQSVYASSKLAAENLLRGSGADYCIMRTIVLFGKGVDLAPDFVAWLLEELLAGREVNIVDDQIGNVTYAPMLSRAILQTLKLRLNGVLHVGSSDIMSRLEFARLVAHQYNLDEKLIHPISTEALRQPAARPLKGGLLTEESQQRLKMKFDSCAGMMQAYAEEEPHTHRLN